MANKCFENYIGIKGSGVTPKSGLYINDLPGINLRSAANIADEDYQSGLEFLQDKINFATNLCIEELTTHFLPHFRLNSVIEEDKIGDFKTNAWPPAALDRGIKIKRRVSRMLKLRVNRVKIRLQEVAFTHSFDIVDGNTITNFAFTTDADGNAEVDCDYQAEEKEIYIIMDDTLINPIDASVKRGCNCYASNGKYIIAYGWNGTGTATSTFGLQAFVAAECSDDEFACAIAHKLNFSILYRTGIEIVKEMIATDRLNSFTLLDAETAEFLLDDFKNEYDQKINTLVASLPEFAKKFDDICVVCNMSHYTTGVP